MTSMSSNSLINGVGSLGIFGGHFELHPPQVQNGLEDLLKHVAVDAFHNSDSKFELPKCYPGTREAIKKDLITWVENVKRPQPIYYLHAPAGSGKTAIAKMLADHFGDPASDRKKFLASFFFSRTATRRNNARNLIPTIAFQIAINIPFVAPLIAKATQRDPSIFSQDLRSQMHALILRPLKSACQSSTPEEQAEWPQLIVLDGLDECQGVPKETIQVKVLQVFTELAQYSRLFPFAIFCSCRPESHIKREFQTHPLAKMSQKVSLSNEFNPKEDIRHFLSSEFKKIRDAHRHLTKFPQGWPGKDTIDSLVQKSSGHFIFPAVVVKFICAPDESPIKRLEVVRGLTTGITDEKPFAQLDALYLHILNSIKSKHRPTAMDAFRFTLAIADVNKLHRIHGSTPAFNPFPKLRDDNWKYSLVSLDGILVKLLDNGLVKFLHDSLSDFLLDFNRSGEFHIDLGKVHATIAVHAIDFIKKGSRESPSQAVLCLFRHAPLSAPTEALRDSLRSLTETKTTTKIVTGLIQFPGKCYWESVIDLGNIIRRSKLKNASAMRRDYLRQVQNYVSSQLVLYSKPPYSLLITLFLSPALVNDYLALVRSTGAGSGSIDSSFIWTALGPDFRTADRSSLNLFRLLNESGPSTLAVQKEVRRFIRDSGYTVKPEVYATICSTMLSLRFSEKYPISNENVVLILNFFRFIAVPLLKEAGPSRELCSQLKAAKDPIYSACDKNVSWMKEDLTRIWLDVDAYRTRVSSFFASAKTASSKSKGRR